MFTSRVLRWELFTTFTAYDGFFLRVVSFAHYVALFVAHYVALFVAHYVALFVAHYVALFVAQVMLYGPYRGVSFGYHVVSHEDDDVASQC